MEIGRMIQKTAFIYEISCILINSGSRKAKWSDEYMLETNCSTFSAAPLVLAKFVTANRYNVVMAVNIEPPQ